MPWVKIIDIMQTHKTLKIIAIAVFLAFLTIASIIFFRNSQTPDKFELLFEGSVSNVQTTNSNIYYLEKNSLVLKRYTLSSQQSEEIYNSEQPISYYYPSPDGKKIVITTAGQNNQNTLFDISNKNSQPLNSCWAATSWTDSATILSNCISQDYEYDPNTINNIELLNLNDNKKSEIANLELEPPLKLLALSTDIVAVVTNNAGYGTNDILLLDINSGTLTKLTSNGYVKDAKAIGSEKLIYSANSQIDPGTFIISRDSRENTKVSSSSDLNLFAAQDNYLFEAKDGFIIKKSLSDPSETNKHTSTKSLGVIKQIETTSSNMILITERGIFTTRLSDL
jgi:hypothetical protein